MLDKLYSRFQLRLLCRRKDTGDIYVFVDVCTKKFVLDNEQKTKFIRVAYIKQYV